MAEEMERKNQIYEILKTELTGCGNRQMQGWQKKDYRICNRSGLGKWKDNEDIPPKQGLLGGRFWR